MRRTIAAVVLALTLAGAACGDESSALEQATPAKDIEQLPPELLPGEILGLKVTREDMKTTLEQAKRSYIDGVGLYSMRRDDLVQATLQVSRFNDDAKYEDPAFRRGLLNQIGGTIPTEVRLGDETVYLTRSTKQTIAVWFRGQHLLVLSTRQDYEQPRTLLREALELEL